jgi:hypothetical protein
VRWLRVMLAQGHRLAWPVLQCAMFCPPVSASRVTPLSVTSRGHTPTPPRECARRETDYDIILGCRDSHVRVISGSIPSMDLALDSAVLCLTNFTSSATLASPTGVMRGGFKEIVYLTQRGTLGQLLVCAPSWLLLMLVDGLLLVLADRLLVMFVDGLLLMLVDGLLLMFVDGLLRCSCLLMLSLHLVGMHQRRLAPWWWWSGGLECHSSWLDSEQG